MLTHENFLNVVDAAPLVAVDLMVVRAGTDVLLGLRNNRPAQGFWFVPGGRIRKNESLKLALKRVMGNELGLQPNALPRSPQALGAYEHFYDDCFAGDVGVSTHYVVVCYLVHVPADFELPQADAQHAELRWWPLADAHVDDSVHHYTRNYLNILSLLKK